MLELLFRKDVGSTFNDIGVVIQTDLRTIIQCHIKMERQDPHAVRRIFFVKNVMQINAL